jgi:PKHD-type hydroxylase
MSIYNFSPTISRDPTITFTTWQDAFTLEELDRIEAYCETLELNEAVIDGPGDPEIRVSQTGWISNNKDTNWFYDRLAFVARKLNSKFYNFDLSGFVEDMQFTVFEGNESGHYAWHIDASHNSIAPRKLSIVLQLSDPLEYEGGELQTMNSNSPSSVTRQRGLIAAFPSWALHRVTPVTSGVRKSIVVWIAGPEFR